MVDLTKFESHLRGTVGSERTVRCYLSDAREFVAFAGNRPADVDTVEAWVASLNHGRCKPQTISRKVAGVRRFLGFVARHGDEAALKTLEILRAYKVTPTVRQADVKQVRAITREAYAALRTKADPRMRALLAAAWWTGARVSELLGDPLTGIPALTVADGLRLVRERYIVTRGKGGRIRVLVLPSAGREDLRGYVEAEARRSGGALFGITPQGLNAWLHRAGFPGGIHSFRHSYRARLRQAGISEELMRRLMGHSAQNVTSGYGEAGVEELLAAVERLA